MVDAVNCLMAPRNGNTTYKLQLEFTGCKRSTWADASCNYAYIGLGIFAVLTSLLQLPEVDLLVRRLQRKS